jgi:hypothetical protein
MTSAAMAMVRVFMPRPCPSSDRPMQCQGEICPGCRGGGGVHLVVTQDSSRWGTSVLRCPERVLGRVGNRRLMSVLSTLVAMTAPLPPRATDVPLTVCRVQDSVVVHLVREPMTGREAVALCGGVLAAGRPERPFVQSPCHGCVRQADEQGVRAVRDLTSAWVNLSRLAVWLRAA